MRLSCNGCRVLRKGCSEDCTIRPCLQWLKSPEAQANATVFLAKFYGRAGLLNLINAGPDHLRPAIFRSLMYEACGRIVNPVYGSVGLLWSGNWHLCQAAVDAVLRGQPISAIPPDSIISSSNNLLSSCDIRHLHRRTTNPVTVAAFDENDNLHRVARARALFKRSSRKKGTSAVVCSSSNESAEGSHVSQAMESEVLLKRNASADVGLELALGLEAFSGGGSRRREKVQILLRDGSAGVDCGEKLELEL